MKLFIYLIFLSSLLSYSQINSGKVIYSASHNKKEIKDAKDDEIKQRVQDLIKNAPDVEFSLVFSKTESLYQKIKSLDNDSFKGINLTETFTSGDHLIYFDANNNIFLDQFELGGEVFTVKKSPFKRQITKESKMIGDYLCYKATLNDDKFNPVATAWFCPEIPFNFGPQIYNSLPGLILRLENKIITFTATEIKLSKKNIKIKKPKGDNIITDEEFRKRFEGFFDEN